ALPELEPDARVPATLSPRIVQDILRDDLGFDGLVVTDALDMNGVTKHFGVGEAAVRTLEAGVDVLLMTRDEYAARAAILAAVEEGRLSEGRIDESLDRILSTKRTLGLTSTPQVDLDALRDRVSTLDHVALNDEIARRSLTLLSNKDTAVPLPRERSNVLVVALNDASDPDAGRYFLRQMRASAPQHSYSLARLDLSSQPQEYSRVLADASAADVIVVPAFVRVRAWSGRIDLSDMHQLFLNALMQKGAPVVLVSFGNPYLISNLDAPSAYLAAFSWSESSQRAVADALAGTSAISGRLPVNIPGTYAFGDGMSVTQRSPRMGTPREGQFSPTLSERVDSLMEASIADRAFPAAAVAIGRPDVTAHLKGYGYLTYESETPVTTHTLFDVASLTKVVATTPAIMRLVEDGKMDLNAPLATYLPEFGRNGKDKVTVRQILTHTAGLKAFYQFYDQGITDRDEIIEFIFNDSLRYEPDTRYVYSDLGMMMLALAVERVSGEAFEDFVQTHIFAPLGMSRSGFRPAGGEGTDPSVVPTEVDEAFGRGLVQGEVHDERAWMLGGVAGHAGLFSCAEDLSLFAQMLLNEGRLHGQQIFKPETVERFTARFPNAIGSDRALGWDTKSPEGYSSAGSKFGSNSFGHTGFTGTSMWMDPDADLFVILLTNRVYPTRDNKKHVPIRPAIADIAFESMIDEPWMIYR
ncbi:MAG: serine hydrolase, partial [Bacteroidota bacterium]